MPRTKLSSTSLRSMSDNDLRALDMISPGVTFGYIKGELKRLQTAVNHMQKGISTGRNYETVRNFEELYIGYDDFFIPYRKKNYKRCLEVLKRDILEVTRKTNKARMMWRITSGVVSELRRRGLLK